MPVKYQSPIFVCDFCGTEKQSKHVPDGWLVYTVPLVGAHIYVCGSCKRRPICDLDALIAKARDDHD